MAISALISDMWNDTKRLHVIGTLTVAAGNYASGGLSLDLLASVDSRPGSSGIPASTQPVWVEIKGIAGYTYEYDLANKKVIMRRVAATPAGTIASTLTVTKGAILASSELGLSADATTATLNNDTIAATRVLTNPVSSVFTGTAIAAALAELTDSAAIPAGVTGDTISFNAIFKMI